MRSFSRFTSILGALLLFTAITARAQKLMGVVSQKNNSGTDRAQNSNRLVISFSGLRSDTITVTDQKSIRIELRSLQVLQEVTIEGWKPTSGIDQSRGINTIVMMEQELFKAACCNLSESFETNPAVDVAFTDAITGTRQIQMLGLSGPNTMISVENMPGVRGLAGSQGIQFIPGSWINSIEVTKGVGSVVNGY